MTAPAHRKSINESVGWAFLSKRSITISAALLLAAALTAGGIAVADRSSPAARSSIGTKNAATPSGSAAPAPTTTTTVPIVPLRVRSVTPAPSATKVSTATLVTITLSEPPAVGSPAPRLSPAVAGRWLIQGRSWTFHPLAGYVPGTKETVSLATSAMALEGKRKVHLTAAFRSTFLIGSGSVLRLQQLLAELHYLPFNYTRPSSAPKAKTTLQTEPTVADQVSTNAQRGRLTWAYPNIPASLAALWATGKANTVTQGAVMDFEADHALAPDGDAGPEVWTALREAVAARQLDPRSYDYIEVTENTPETLTVWEGGRNDIYSSPANTGVEGAATQTGTFPVYLRYASHAMIGTDTDGTKYDDPDIPWIAYFNGGDAIHGYPRSEYGFPQSNGCVELPIANAGEVWNSGQDWYGTLVTVE
jgi:peptidoglycan hydrolase-like protein with peptidoglycan-binding domain